jgi:ATP-dependent exoDNAse (exonuclease V) alpha subunit
MIEKENPFPTCSAEDLQTEIKLGIGARVMLTRNIDTEDGLVNGAFGTVKGVDVSNSGKVTSVYVLFDNINVGKNALKKQVVTLSSLRHAVRLNPFMDVLCGKNASRKQLPLKLAWAATIHKVQGMTVDQIVVSLKTTFQPGMAYVALSRSTSLAGLHILDFNPDSIYSSDRITEALQSMPLFLKQSQPSTYDSSFQVIVHNTEADLFTLTQRYQYF